MKAKNLNRNLLVFCLSVALPAIAFGQATRSQNNLALTNKNVKTTDTAQTTKALSLKVKTQTNLSAVPPAAPGITDHVDVQIHPTAYEQAEEHISINRSNPNILVVSSNTWVTQGNQGRYVSTNGGATWTGVDVLNSNYPLLYGDPSTAIDASGNIYISGLNATNTPDGYIVQKSTDNGNTFGNLINGVTNAPGFDKDMIAADNQSTSPYKNYLYAAWTNLNANNSIKFNRSTDGANTFSTPITLKSGNGQGANIQTGPNGEVYVCYADYGTGGYPSKGLGFVKSTDGGASFTAARVVASYTGIMKSDGPDPSFNNIGVNDFPAIAVDKSGGTHNGRIYAVVAVQQNGNGKAIIVLTYSDNQGTTWTTPTQVSISIGIESFFPWVAVDQVTGGLYIAYFSIDGSGYQTNTYVAISNDGGSTFTNQKVSDVSHVTQPITSGNHRLGYEGDYIGIAAQSGKAYVAWMDERTGNWQAWVSEVDNLPAINGTTTAFCSSASFTASNLPPGQTVTWSVSPSGIVSLSPSGNSVTVTKIAQGGVTLTATLPSGVAGTLYLTTVPDVTSIASNMSGPCTNGYQTWYLQATPNMSASNWQWSVVQPTSGTFIIESPNSPATNVRVTGGGQVQVTFQDACGETSRVEGVTIYSPCTMHSLAVFPNPASAQLTIEDNALATAGASGNTVSSTPTNGNFSAELYDGNARIVKSGQTKQGSQSLAFNVSDLTSGTYYLHIKKNGEVIERQIIIQH